MNVQIGQSPSVVEFVEGWLVHELNGVLAARSDDASR